MAVAFNDIPPAPDIHFAAEAAKGVFVSIHFRGQTGTPKCPKQLGPTPSQWWIRKSPLFQYEFGWSSLPIFGVSSLFEPHFFSKIGAITHEHLNLSRSPPEHLASSPTCLLRHLKSRSGPIIHWWFLGKSPHSDQKHGSFLTSSAKQVEEHLESLNLNMYVCMYVCR